MSIVVRLIAAWLMEFPSRRESCKLNDDECWPYYKLVAVNFKIKSKKLFLFDFPQSDETEKIEKGVLRASPFRE